MYQTTTVLHDLEKLAGEGANALSPEALRRETEQLKRRVVYETFQLEDTSILERYIQYCQRSVVHIMDSMPAIPTSIQSSHYIVLDELLTFLEDRFQRYFDEDARPPRSRLALARQEVGDAIVILEGRLEKQGACERIRNLILHELKVFADGDGYYPPTFRTIKYLTLLQQKLFKVLDQDITGESLNDALLNLLYYLNFNSINVFNYHAHFIKSVIGKAETRAEKIEKLSYTLKKINQSPMRPGVRYNQDASSLKEQVTSYILEEIFYLEKTQSLTSVSPGGEVLQGFKIKLEASVSQLAYLLRVFMETKIVRNENLTEMLRFLTRFVMTKRAENISFESFRIKFYDVESGTREAVRELLLKMVKHIDRS